MSFLNGVLLLGGLAFVVPLVIHLLNRSKFQTVDWGAMHLLNNTELQNAKKIQWQALLLLLLRCAVPIVLAVCMARPLWNYWSGGRIGDAATTVFLLDDSYSMQAPAASERLSNDESLKTRFAQMIQSAQGVVDGVGERSAKAIISFGGLPNNWTQGTSYDSKPIMRQIDRLQPLRGPVSPISALQLAIETLETSPQPYRQIVLWSDFQQHDWARLSPDSLRSIKDRLQTMAIPAQLHLVPVRTSEPANLQLSIDALTSELTLLGEPLEIRATVGNHGTAIAAETSLTLLLDDRETAVRKIQVPANSEMQTSFWVSLDTPGVHWVEVRIEDPGSVDADNRDRLRIESLPPVRVLLIEEDLQRPLLESETGFLQLALQSSARDEGGTTAMLLDRQPISRVTPPILETSDVIILADVARLEDDDLQAIHARVEQGASLWVFPGERIDRNWYEQQIGSASSRPLLGYRYGELKNAPAGPPPSSSDQVALETLPLRIAAGPYYDPALSLFNNPQQGRLDQIAIRSWLPLEQAESSTIETGMDAEKEQVLLRIKDDSPLLVRRKYGQGVVLQWAIRANDAWSDLPIRPAFVPLVQRLVLYSHGNVEPHATLELRKESKDDPMSTADIEQLAGALGASVHESAAGFLQQDRQQRFGREFWRWILMALLVVLFGELLVARRITKGDR